MKNIRSEIKNSIHGFNTKDKGLLEKDKGLLNQKEYQQKNTQIEDRAGKYRKENKRYTGHGENTLHICVFGVVEEKIVIKPTF